MFGAGGGACEGGGDFHPRGVRPGVGHAGGGVLASGHPAAVELGGAVHLGEGVAVLRPRRTGDPGEQQGVGSELRAGGRGRRRRGFGVDMLSSLPPRTRVRQALFRSPATLFASRAEGRDTLPTPTDTFGTRYSRADRILTEPPPPVRTHPRARAAPPAGRPERGRRPEPGAGQAAAQARVNRPSPRPAPRPPG